MLCWSLVGYSNPLPFTTLTCAKIEKHCRRQENGLHLEQIKWNPSYDKLRKYFWKILQLIDMCYTDMSKYWKSSSCQSNTSPRYDSKKKQTLKYQTHKQTIFPVIGHGYIFVPPKSPKTEFPNLPKSQQAVKGLRQHVRYVCLNAPFWQAGLENFISHDCGRKLVLALIVACWQIMNTFFFTFFWLEPSFLK